MLVHLSTFSRSGWGRRGRGGLQQQGHGLRGRRGLRRDRHAEPRVHGSALQLRRAPAHRAALSR